MTAELKPGVSTYVSIIKRACHFIVKHQGTFDAVFALAITDPVDLAAVRASYAAITAACAVLDRVYPNIP